MLKFLVTLQILTSDRVDAVGASLADRRAAMHARSDRGATAVEYGLMVALIAAVIITAVTLLGGSLKEKFSDVADAVTKAGN